MRSLDPSDRETFPLPDHTPLNPANGLDWAWPADTENNNAAPTPAALIACPNNLESDGFILIFSNSLTFLQKKSRHIESLVSPPSVRFKRHIDRCAAIRRSAARSHPISS